MSWALDKKVRTRHQFCIFSSERSLKQKEAFRVVIIHGYCYNFTGDEIELIENELTIPALAHVSSLTHVKM